MPSVTVIWRFMREKLEKNCQFCDENLVLLYVQTCEQNKKIMKQFLVFFRNRIRMVSGTAD